MDYISYRNMIIGGKIEECLQQVRIGETEIVIDLEDLTSDEQEYLEQEVSRRIGLGCF